MINNIKRRYQHEREGERKVRQMKRKKNNRKKYGKRKRENEGVMNNDGD